MEKKDNSMLKKNIIRCKKGWNNNQNYVKVRNQHLPHDDVVGPHATISNILLEN